MAEHLLFPTLITQGKRDVSEKEKIDWFDSYLENSNEHGESMDYLGFVSMHHDPRFEMVFYDIANAVKEHLESLGIDSTTICVNITKSWFNVNTKEARNPIHEHAESHYSMTYCLCYSFLILSVSFQFSCSYLNISITIFLCCICN